MEGFTHLIPHAAGHELIRQRRRHLHLVRMTPDVVYDQLIGAGCVDSADLLVGRQPGVGSLQRFRDAVENGWPQPLEIEEHSHAGMATRYAAGAAGLPFGVLRGYVGTDLAEHTTRSGRSSARSRANDSPRCRRSTPTSRSSTPSGPTARATSRSGASSACRRRPCSPPDATIVTVEQIVDELTPVPGIVLPTWVVTAVCEVPVGAHPSFAMGYCDATTPSTAPGTRSQPRRFTEFDEHGMRRQSTST